MAEMNGETSVRSWTFWAGLDLSSMAETSALEFGSMLVNAERADMLMKVSGSLRATLRTGRADFAAGPIFPRDAMAALRTFGH
jgi:hypothetical protein